eukprot:7405187-Ditylum_brightwellii.AAC.1
MKKNSEVIQAVKQFTKETGAPEAIICDGARAQSKGKDILQFMAQVGTTLRVLEEGTPWAIKAKLYIKLFKQTVRKDMKESNCPLVFWDYCSKKRAHINNLTAKDRTTKFSFSQEVLGRVLGPARGEGNEMAQWVLKANGKVVPRRTCRLLHTDETHSEQEKKQRE